MADPKAFLSDEEMAALEQQSAPPQFIPDEAAAGPQPMLAGMGAPAAPAVPQRELQPATKAQSAGRGSLAYGSFNFGDEISAGVGAGLYGLAKGVRSILPGGVPEDAPSVSDVYGRILEGERGAYKSAAAAHPVYYHGAGIATSALQVPGVAKVGQLSNAARIAQLAQTGAITSGLSAAGASEGDIGERLGHGARGAVYGALLAPIGDAAVRGLGAVSGKIARAADKTAGFAFSRIAGGIQRDVAQAGGWRKFAEAGLEGYRRGIIQPFGSAETRSDAVADLLQQSGDVIEQTLKGVGSVPLADVQNSIVGATSKLRQTPRLNSGKIAEVDRLLEDLDNLSGGSGALDASQLQVAKEAVSDLIKSWDPGRLAGRADKALERMRQKLYMEISGQQEQAVSQVAGALAPYQIAKGDYSLGKTLAAFGESAERRNANALSQVGGLPGAGAGAGAIMHMLATGDVIKPLLLYGGTRVLTSPRTIAIGALAAGKAARALPAYAQSSLNPLLARSAAQGIVAALEDE